ncbi:MAG: TetR/AcrR family transcriptional regulator [Lachnospiraceae bacterium]|nr:TetR/AcrR family transcriptional regulator [Lachnospiraceae bacterium]
MGKVEENKRLKKDAIVNSAFSLFIQKGINETSIADIMKKAELAKGTFYLYFKDKFEVRDYLVRKKATQIFEDAYHTMEQSDVVEFDDKIIFLVDHMLNQLNDNKILLRFISKNLSWGIFRHAIQNMSGERGLNAEDCMKQMFEESDLKFRNPEMLLFMIIELVNSTAHNVILYRQPVELPELKEYLYPLIRRMIRDFTIEESELVMV